MIKFAVPGVPIGQGNLRSGPTGRAYEATKNHKPWRESLIFAAREVHDGELLTGPVAVVAQFVFPRLKSHYRTGKRAGEVKETAPVLHISKPDLDHLQRSVGDALTLAGVLKDDAQICRWATTKTYGSFPGVSVEVHCL